MAQGSEALFPTAQGDTAHMDTIQVTSTAPVVFEEVALALLSCLAMADLMEDQDTTEDHLPHPLPRVVGLMEDHTPEVPLISALLRIGRISDPRNNIRRFPWEIYRGSQERHPCRAPSSNTWYDSGAGGSSEPAVAEGMGIEDAPGDEREPEEVKDANSPKESSSSNDFLAVRVEESKKEQQEKADALKEEALKAKKKALREALERRRAKKAEEKREEELKKEEEKEEAKKEDAKESEADESLDREEPAKEETEEEREEGGSHKLKSHKKESHEEESHKEESHEEEHSSA
ncbi:hypothetical protein EBH_0005660 [Eimeria brunetti]|uniref:Uncharacterized protein n=1 Tax=Eimeria brunetti TaxID=51314 RepID=U6LYW2_9EIME|nr:hypothetical protein EBH_0005660 [Eimeria brunetti]